MVATQSNILQRVSEHDVLLATLGTVVTELHENAKEDRAEAKEVQKAVALLVARDVNQQKWVDSFRNLVFSISGGGVMYILVHFLHF